jgi:hypothetical protein
MVIEYAVTMRLAMSGRIRLVMSEVISLACDEGSVRQPCAVNERPPLMRGRVVLPVLVMQREVMMVPPVVQALLG